MALFGLRLVAREVTVFAAASLTDSLKAIAKEYEESSGDRVFFNFDASSTLSRQIQAGAPCDIFFSADEAKMDLLEKANLIEKSSRKSLLGNALVIIVSTNGSLDIKNPRDLMDKRVERIALAEPATVPAGIYAKEYLKKLNLWDSVESKVIPTQNVRAALAAVEAGNADAGIVYQTDAAISKKVRVAYLVPVSEGPKISYPVALMKSPIEAVPRESFTTAWFRLKAQRFSRNTVSSSVHDIRKPHGNMSGEEWNLIFFTLWVSTLSTLVILPFGLTAAWLLARYEWRGKSLVETLVSLPLVMPPVATGLILLQILGRRGIAGGFFHKHFDFDIAFTWRGVLVALGVMSFPLLVRSSRNSFEQVDPRLEQIARTLGAGNFRVFWTISLPLAMRGIIGGMLLAFARALGEFGATIMVAGNIPGKTSTLSLAIFQEVQLGRDGNAFRLLGVSVVLAFLAVWGSEWLAQRRKK